MFIARWTIEAKFGHKEQAVGICKRWDAEVGQRLGLKFNKRVLTGSIGAPESRLEFETHASSLAELEKNWAEMAKMPAHEQFSKDLEPHIVSGSNSWQIFRVVEV